MDRSGPVTGLLLLPATICSKRLMPTFSQIAPQTNGVGARSSPPRASVGLHLLLLAAALFFFALHFVHLSADFPNFSRWMDWSKYTDEGWYGDAAIRFYQLGHWNLPGDFNPAVALPIWPLLEALLFRFTGVSLVAERALTVSVFGAILLMGWLFIARRNAPKAPWFSTDTLPAAFALLFLAVNPFCFVFTRMGIIEPLLILNTLLALLTAQTARPSFDGQSLVATARANLRVVVVLGLLIPILILTKTTGLFLVPSIVWMLFTSLRYRLRDLLAVAMPAGVLALSLWLAYFLLLVRPHYLLDYQYLFSANAYTGISRDNWFSVIGWSIHGIAWMGRTIAVCACAAVAFACAQPRRLRDAPVIASLILWAAGYTAFLAYHNNLQPRYYLVVAVPLTLLLPVVVADLILPRLHHPGVRRLAFGAVLILSAAILLPDARETLHFVRHPQYTFLGAAEQIATYIRRADREDPSHSSLVLSISGSDLSLMTGLHSICDDFGTSELADRARQYKPGWYVSWNLLEDDKMDALTPAFNVKRVATFAAMDDLDRNQLILYRLTPADAQPRLRLRHAHPRIGQQPSPLQLGH
jgi:hypothetical protein